MFFTPLNLHSLGFALPKIRLAEKEKWTEKRILHICETYYDEDCGGMKYFAIAKYGMEFKQSELDKIQEADFV